MITCRLCGRVFTPDLDDIPLVFDRVTQAPAPVCYGCADDIREVLRAYQDVPS